MFDEASARRLAQRALTVAAGKIDILVNNAGSATTGPTATFDEPAFDNLFAVNVKAPFYLVAAIAPTMAARGNGEIVNVTSIAARVGSAGMTVYGATKTALNLLTLGWTAEFGPQGVRVNAVSSTSTTVP